MDIVKTKREAPSQRIIFCFGETSLKHNTTYNIKTSSTAISKHGKARISAGQNQQRRRVERETNTQNIQLNKLTENIS